MSDPSLFTLVKRALRSAAPKRMLIALSGGPDSMVLMHVLWLLREKYDLTLFAHGVDHGLRESAGSELELAREFANKLNIPFSVSHLKIDAKSNLQAIAREKRYEALRRAKESVGVDWICTGHHKDDRAETILIRLLRGAGPRGLATLPLIHEDKLRPLLFATKADVLLHAARHGVPYALDPSNEHPRFLRTRVRKEVLPLLKELDPQIVDHLCDLSTRLASTLKYLPVKESDVFFHLPSKTQKALAELPEKTGKVAHVLLPGGSAVFWDRIEKKYSYGKTELKRRSENIKRQGHLKACGEN